MLRKLTFGEFVAVRRALRAGARHVEIARELDLGVWTVDRIAARLRYAEEGPSDEEPPEDDAPADYVARNMRRCEGCGGMVYVWPCIACQMATMTPVAPAPEVEEEVIEIELPRPLTVKQRRWRRRLMVERVFG
jgi:hypothetical protein